MSSIIRSAVILCGGKGTRLGTLGKKTPKSLVKIHNYPILWFILKILKKNKFNHFILPVGFQGKKIKKYISSHRELNKFNIDLVDTGKNTSIAKRIHRIKRKISSQKFILVNGDAIFNFDLNKIFNNHVRKKNDMTFIGCEAKLNFGIVGKIKNKIVSFERDVDFNSIKKIKNSNFLGYVYSGISIMNKKLLKKNFKNFENFEKSFYPPIIKKFKTNLEQIQGFWSSIDNVKDMEDLNKKKNMKKYNAVKKLKKQIKDY